MSFITDVKCAFRSLGRVKGMALSMIITLGLGIGANAAMFTIVRGVLLRWSSSARASRSGCSGAWRRR
jgi:putative ABC transport system permease protein